MPDLGELKYSNFMPKSFGQRFVDIIFNNGQIVALFFAFLVIGSIAAFAGSKVKGFPDVSINIAVVTSVYPGATAGQVQEQVIKPIEGVVADLKGVTEYSSTANDSFGAVTVTYEDGVDLDEALRDLSGKLTRVRLPEGAKEPEVLDVTAGGGFDFLVGVTGLNDEFALYREANIVKTQLEGVKGVSKVSIVNPLEPTVQIVFNQDALASRRLTRAQVESVVKMAQLDIPVGSFVNTDNIIVNLGVVRKLESPTEIANLLVAPNVRLADVATLNFLADGNDKYNRIGYSFGDAEDIAANGNLAVSQAIMLQISSKEGTDILALDKRLDERYEDLALSGKIGPDTRLVTLFDQAESTREQVQEIQAGLIGENIKQWGDAGFLGFLFGGLLLVVLLLLILVNWRVALMAAISIPLSLGVGVLYLKLIGVDLNTLVLFSMVLVIGLVVDPTIVFLEALYRYRMQGLSPREAAAKTINSVGVGIGLAAIANFIVFVPFGVVSGFFGQIIRYIPITVIPAIVASFIVPAVFFLPVAAHWLKPRVGVVHAEEGELSGAWPISRWLNKSIRGLLGRGSSTAFLRVMVVIVAIILPVAIAGSLIGSGAIRFVQFSEQEDSTMIFVQANVNKEWSFERAVNAVLPVQNFVAQQPEVKNFAYFDQNGNSFTMLVTLWPIVDRQMQQLRTATELEKDFNNYFATLDGVTLTAQSDSGGPPEELYPVKVRVFDQDPAKLKLAADDITTYLKGRDDVAKVTDSLSSAGQSVTGTALVLDPENVANINPFIAVGALKERLDETEISKISIGGESWKVVSTMNPAIRSVDEAKQIGFGPISLGGLTTGTSQQVATTLQSLNGKRYVEVQAQVKEDIDPVLVQTELNQYLNDDKLEDLGLESANTESSGVTDSIGKSFTDLFVALIIALFMIYVLLVGFFRSLVAPLIIMFAIPLGFAGVFPAVAWSTGQLGFLELLGVVAMAGIVVNVTILIIDYANRLVAEGMTVQDAIATSVAVRYKAIFLTKVTIFAGLMPLAIFSPFWRGLALVMIFGIIVSAILSLFTTPILYVWSKGRLGRKKNEPISNDQSTKGSFMVAADREEVVAPQMPLPQTEPVNMPTPSVPAPVPPVQQVPAPPVVPVPPAPVQTEVAKVLPVEVPQPMTQTVEPVAPHVVNIPAPVQEQMQSAAPMDQVAEVGQSSSTPSESEIRELLDKIIRGQKGQG